MPPGSIAGRSRPDLDPPRSDGAGALRGRVEMQPRCSAGTELYMGDGGGCRQHAACA
jgi:hypothetical protein